MDANKMAMALQQLGASTKPAKLKVGIVDTYIVGDRGSNLCTLHAWSEAE